MKVVDANVLLYAVNADSPHHLDARQWLDEALDAGEAVGFAWVVLLAFLRLSTSHAVFPTPLTVDEALAVVEHWLNTSAATIVDPLPRHLEILASLLTPAGTGGNLVTDAHLAALAIEHRAQLVSFDSDFGRFPRLDWTRPTST